MYIEGPPPLYISYASPDQTRQDRYQDTLEAAGDKGQRIKKVTKVIEGKQCMEGGLQEDRWHPFGQAQWPLNVSIMCFIYKITYKQY